MSDGVIGKWALDLMKKTVPSLLVNTFFHFLGNQKVKFGHPRSFISPPSTSWSCKLGGGGLPPGQSLVMFSTGWVT